MQQYYVKYNQTTRNDNGAEFNMPPLKKNNFGTMLPFYSNIAILYQTSCVKRPQQNLILERKYRQLLNVTKALFFHYKLPNSFWSCYTPHEILYS